MLGLKLEIISQEIYQMATMKLNEYRIPATLGCLVMSNVCERIRKDALICAADQMLELEQGLEKSEELGKVAEDPIEEAGETDG